MKSVSIASARHLAGTPKPRVLDRLARGMVLRQLEKIAAGQLVLREQESSWTFGNGAGPSATLTVRDPMFYSDIAFGGTIGAGEAYIHGYWQCSDLVALVRILARNREVLEGMESGLARLTQPLQSLFHWINRNTREGAQRNISAHYDLGNDFFSLWLDESMMYSAAVFPRADASLADAQFHRLNRICDKLELEPDDHLVEIGTGWGGLALHAATHYGCRVTTTTISREQYEMARRRVAAAGLADRVEVLFRDYRDLDGQYDKLVSIEMIEAIGAEQYPVYFEQCSRLLRPGGRLLIQAITIADRQYESARRSVDFIKRYIFPGSCIPSLSVLIGTLGRQGDLVVTGVEDIGLHYASTLAHWRRNFFARIDQIRALGYSEEFVRMWDFYFCYCEGGFRERAISDVHLVAEKIAAPHRTRTAPAVRERSL